MKVLSFILWLFKKFPSKFIINLASFIGLGVMEMVAFISIAPLIDIYLKTDAADVGYVTDFSVKLMKFFGIPYTNVAIITIFLSFAFLKSLFFILAKYTIFQTKFSVEKELTIETHKNIFNASWSFFSRSNHGEILNTFKREIAIAGSSLSTIGEIGVNIFRFIFFIVVPFYISWKITTVVIGLGFFFAIPTFMLGRVSYKLGQKSTLTAKNFTKVLYESFGAAKIIIGHGNQKKHEIGIERSFEEHRKVAIKLQTLLASIGIIYEPFGWLIILIAFYLSQNYFSIPVSDATIMVYAFLKVIPIIGMFSAQKNSLSSFIPSFEQVMKLSNQAKQNIQESGGLPFKQFNKKIELKNVQFSYPNNNGKNYVLNNVNITIGKNKMIALVGESGSGKTTVVDILAGFHKCDHGEVLIDGVPLFEYDINSFRKRIGFVPQDDILFDTSITNNLLWSKDDATTEDIVNACKQANAHDFVLGLQDGYETIVGDRGMRLSGGERQRIALARAMLRKPEILILDEATSFLDSKSETLISKAIEGIMHQTTIVVIAHRLSTIIQADCIYVLENGSIVDEGSYEELVNLDGVFHKMLMAQGLIV